MPTPRFPKGAVHVWPNGRPQTCRRRCSVPDWVLYHAKPVQNPRPHSDVLPELYLTLLLGVNQQPLLDVPPHVPACISKGRTTIYMVTAVGNRWVKHLVFVPGRTCVDNDRLLRTRPGSISGPFTSDWKGYAHPLRTQQIAFNLVCD